MDEPDSSESKVRRSERDVRRRVGVVILKRFPGSSVFIQDDELRVGDGRREGSTPCVGRDRRFPGSVVGVEIAENDGVVVGVGKKGVDVRSIAAMTGSCWRDVDVEEVDVRVVDDELDCLEFGVGVVEEGSVNGGKGDGVVNEERHSTPATPTLSVLIDESVARDGRKTVVGAKLGFLKSCDGDAVVVEEASEFVDLVVDSIAVPLQEDGKWRTRRRAGIRVDSADEKKSQNESAREEAGSRRKAKRWPADDEGRGPTGRGPLPGKKG